MVFKSHHQTKLVCTLGPSVDSFSQVKELLAAGMDVARLNFGHGTYEEHEKRIQWVKQARQEGDRSVAIMADIKGPEVRVGLLRGPLTICEGSSYTLVNQKTYDRSPEGCTLPVQPQEILAELQEGYEVLLDDGYLSAIIEKSTQGLALRFTHGGTLSSHKSLSVHQARLHLPAFTSKDRQDLLFLLPHQVEWVAVSFVRGQEHLNAVREFLTEHGQVGTRLVAKIENQQGLDNFDEILAVSDGIMVARGDLGVELPLEQVPKWQKWMVERAIRAGKLVIIATQMLESMVHSPRPTRAEVSDVANAIYDQSGAVMLSGESAAGSYPIEAVSMMHRIIAVVEEQPHQEAVAEHDRDEQAKEAIALATVEAAYKGEISAIFCVTRDGQSMRRLARHRPKLPIFAITSNPFVYHQLALEWAAIPLLLPTGGDMELLFMQACALVVEKGYLLPGTGVLLTGDSSTLIAETESHLPTSVRGDASVSYRRIV